MSAVTVVASWRQSTHPAASLLDTALSSGPTGVVGPTYPGLELGQVWGLRLDLLGCCEVGDLSVGQSGMGLGLELGPVCLNLHPIGMLTFLPSSSMVEVCTAGVSMGTSLD